MDRLQNQWLIQNNRQVQALKRQLLEYQYKGMEDLPARTIQAILESAIIEIGRMQRELDTLNAEMKVLKNKEAAPIKNEK